MRMLVGGVVASSVGGSGTLRSGVGNTGYFAESHSSIALHQPFSCHIISCLVSSNNPNDVIFNNNLEEAVLVT